MVIQGIYNEVDTYTLEQMKRIRGGDLKPVEPTVKGYKGPVHKVGSTTRYNAGCRCNGCRAANRRVRQKNKTRTV